LESEAKAFITIEKYTPETNLTDFAYGINLKCPKRAQDAVTSRARFLEIFPMPQVHWFVKL
jgi:hypothetical protein